MASPSKHREGYVSEVYTFLMRTECSHLPRIQLKYGQYFSSLSPLLRHKHCCYPASVHSQA